MLQCYNKGCGQKFDPSENNADSCQFHPGCPIFHDAKKKWSCCDKSSTDFSEFLSIKGCSKGHHNDVKPVEMPKPYVNVSACESLKPSCSPTVIHKPIQPPLPRPSSDDPLVPLTVELAQSLKNLLNQMSIKDPLGTSEQPHGSSTTTSSVSVGTSCKNSGCKVTYSGPETDAQLCTYHPGYPLFHEGMKFWTCCNRKTTEFDVFMDQVGCATGRHNWTENSARDSNLVLSLNPTTACRYDWFQLAPEVIVSVYAKGIHPDSVVVEGNRVKLNVSFKFGADKKPFKKAFDLDGVIDPQASLVKLVASKMEIVLKKAEACSWTRLERQAPKGDEAK